MILEMIPGGNDYTTLRLSGDPLDDPITARWNGPSNQLRKDVARGLCHDVVNRAEEAGADRDAASAAANAWWLDWFGDRRA